MNDDYKNDLKDFFLIYDADRKSTRLNSSHSQISYAVFCLKKKISDLRRPDEIRVGERPPPPAFVLNLEPLHAPGAGRRPNHPPSPKDPHAATRSPASASVT